MPVPPSKERLVQTDHSLVDGVELKEGVPRRSFGIKTEHELHLKLRVTNFPSLKLTSLCSMLIRSSYGSTVTVKFRKWAVKMDWVFCSWEQGTQCNSIQISMWRPRSPRHEVWAKLNHLDLAWSLQPSIAWQCTLKEAFSQCSYLKAPNCFSCIHTTSAIFGSGVSQLAFRRPPHSVPGCRFAFTSPSLQFLPTITVAFVTVTFTAR